MPPEYWRLVFSLRPHPAVTIEVSIYISTVYVRSNFYIYGWQGS